MIESNHRSPQLTRISDWASKTFVFALELAKKSEGQSEVINCEASVDTGQCRPSKSNWNSDSMRKLPEMPVNILLSEPSEKIHTRKGKSQRRKYGVWTTATVIKTGP